MKIYLLVTVGLLSIAVGQTPAAFGQTPAPPPANEPVADSNPDRVVATIGDEKITAAQLDIIIKTMPLSYQAEARGAAKRQFVDYLVRIKLLARKGEQMHLDKTPVARQRIKYETEKLLADKAYMAIIENTKVDTVTLQKYYNDHKNDYKQIWAHHLLIRFEGSPLPLKEGQKDLSEEDALAKARELVKRLKDGEDFAAIAEAESADATSAKQGGDLGGPLKRGQTVDDSAFLLSPGQIGDPVKTQLGFDIIRVDKVEVKSFEEARAEMEAKLKPQLANKRLESLKAATPVKLDEKFFGVPTPNLGLVMPTH